jgi:gliding motility-associated-like protein
VNRFSKFTRPGKFTLGRGEFLNGFNFPNQFEISSLQNYPKTDGQRTMRKPWQSILLLLPMRVFSGSGLSVTRNRWSYNTSLPLMLNFSRMLFRSIHVQFTSPGSFLFKLLFLLLVPALLPGQALVNVTVTGGNSTTTCTDFLSGPDPQWSVNIEGEGWLTYPFNGGCYQDPPFLQYEGVFACPGDLPATVEICFRAFEDDGFFCNPVTACNEEVCQDFVVPAPGTSANYVLSLPAGGASEGQVQFTIETDGALAINDDICNAIDLGTLVPGGVLGDPQFSSWTNECATNLNEPNPDANGWWSNDHGVWFTFTTSATPSAVIPMVVTNDPEGLGNSLHTQIAVYESSDGSCTGSFSLVKQEFKTGTFDQLLLMECLEPSTTYYILIDGSGLIDPQAIMGYFGLGIYDGEVIEAGDTRCESEDLGVVPDGGAVSALNQTNMCASNAGDPFIVAGLFGVARGVWFQFTPPPSGNVIIEVESDEAFPQGFGAIDLEIALYHTTNNLCSGFRVLDTASYQNNNFNEAMEVECLDPAIPYWVLVDGSALDDFGVFDISITDGGNAPPSITIDTVLCFGESVSIAGNIYDASGNYAEAFPLGNGCDSTVFINLTVQDELIASGVEVEPSSSIVFPNGIATVDVSGGGGPFTYLWTNGMTADTITGLSEGTYCVLVTDTLGCTDTACIAIQLMLEPVIASLENDSLDCFGDTDGMLQIEATGGDAPYAVDWEAFGSGNSGTTSLPVEGGTVTLDNLEPDTYSVTLTDLNGTTTVIQGAVYEPPLLELALDSQQDPSCFGLCDGQISVLAQGGTPPYAYSWSNGQSQPDLTDLCSGTYTLEITDANGCTESLSVSLTDPPEFIATASPLSPVTCFGGDNGSATVTTNGSPASYEWDNGELTATASNLTTGLHTVTVVNSDGCEDIATVTVEGPASPLSASIVVSQPISCFEGNDGVLSLTPSGGAGNGYSAIWEPGGPGLEATGLSTGTYSVTLTDGYGCTLVSSAFIPEPPPIDAVFSVRDATCIGNEQDGEIELLEVTGGQAPYSFGLSQGNLGTDSLFSGLTPNSYLVYIQDGLGCVESFGVTVAPPPPLALETSGDVTIQMGEETQLEAFTIYDENVVFSWTPADSLSCADCPEPLAFPLRTSRYTVTALDTVSLCSAVDFLTVTVSQERNLFFPNIFSPDGDGRNDRFTLFAGPEVRQINSLQVYNRWGSLVYEQTNFPPGNISFGWDGTYKDKTLEPGVYLYFAEVEFLDGIVQKYGGDVTLVR